MSIAPYSNILVESLCRHTQNGNLPELFSQEEFAKLTGWSHAEVSLLFNQLVQSGQLTQHGEEYSWSQEFLDITKNYNKLANILTKIVDEAPGIKANKLAAEFIKQAYMAGLPTPDITFIANFAKLGGIEELQYTLPHSLSSESLYFPKGTSVETL